MFTKNKTLRTLLSQEQIATRVKELGAQIANEYRDRPVILITILKGSFLFAADLARAIDLEDLRIEFMGLRSYGSGTESSGVVQITYDLSVSIVDCDVIVVEDIVDTGLTMQYLMQNLATRRPRSVKLCSLLHKPSRARVKTHVDYLGFTIDDHFVIGYGLDYDERYRNLPYIGVLEG